MKALRKRKRVKTDPADSYELANLLRLESLPEAYIAPHDLRELRELVRHRRQLVKLATTVKAGIRALLAKHNIRLSATQLESDTATGLLDALALPGSYATRLASQRRLMLVLADEIAATEVELHTRLRNHLGYRNQPASLWVNTRTPSGSCAPSMRASSNHAATVPASSAG
jgi:transposase